MMKYTISMVLGAKDTVEFCNLQADVDSIDTVVGSAPSISTD